MDKIKKANKDGIRNSFLDTAEALYLIKKKRTYKSIKPDDVKYTFEKYCLETKYLPGSTPNARRTFGIKADINISTIHNQEDSQECIAWLGLCQEL